MRLQGEDSLGLDVTVILLLLVADSRLARAMLASHEGQERLVTLAGVEGDTLGHYAQILRTGRTEVRGGDRYPEIMNIKLLINFCIVE